jgi:hypothetical protein
MTTPTFTIGATKVAPPKGWNINGMEFDAWLRLNHNTSLTITQHPVETGATITDHSYRNPRRFSFDIGMSDTVGFAILPANLTIPHTPLSIPLPAIPIISGDFKRSANAYNALVAMQLTRQILTLDCKYGGYDNVLIESIDVSDDYTTKNALKATVNLLEVFLVDTQLTKVSTNPHATNSTNRGRVSPIPALFTKERIFYFFNQTTQAWEEAMKSSN